MIRLRGALSVIVAGLLCAALSFTGAVAAYAMPHDGQGQTARLHAAVSIRLAEPIEDLKREPSDATRHKTGCTTQQVLLDTWRQTTGRYFYVGERAHLWWRHLRPERRGEGDVRAAQ